MSLQLWKGNYECFILFLLIDPPYSSHRTRISLLMLMLMQIISIVAYSRHPVIIWGVKQVNIVTCWQHYIKKVIGTYSLGAITSQLTSGPAGVIIYSAGLLPGQNTVGYHYSGKKINYPDCSNICFSDHINKHNIQQVANHSRTAKLALYHIYVALKLARLDILSPDKQPLLLRSYS